MVFHWGIISVLIQFTKRLRSAKVLVFTLSFGTVALVERLTAGERCPTGTGLNEQLIARHE